MVCLSAYVAFLHRATGMAADGRGLADHNYSSAMQPSQVCFSFLCLRIRTDFLPQHPARAWTPTHELCFMEFLSLHRGPHRASARGLVVAPVLSNMVGVIIMALVKVRHRPLPGGYF